MPRDRNRFLSDLPSYQFYRQLNNDFSECRYCDYCDDPIYKFSHEIPKKIFCYQFVKNLEILKEKNNNDEDLKNMYCNHLIHWIYEKYYNMSLGHGVKMTEDFTDKLNKVTNAIFSRYTSDRDYCENVIKKKLSYQDIKKRKDFHDYYVNYKFIHRKSTEANGKCYNFYDYLNSRRDFYDDMVKQCKEDREEKYCEHINYTNCKPQTLINLPQCNNEKKGSPEGPDIPEDALEVKDGYRLRYVWETDDYIYFSDYRFILLVGLSIWGVILSLFLLYKNTPVGLWIKNFLKKKEIITSNFDLDVEHDMLPDNSDNLHANFERGPYSVGYYPG
ncbi:PIR protein [Plasmodium ovale]|uniref:PIR protein n=1 Tax=Plasmodium ovale TaxID=36330 RepID=A0A1C3KJJ8_PLAOA|nr:PIR protein [Plasmodium ovale]